MINEGLSPIFIHISLFFCMIITSNNKKDKNYKFSICTPCYNNSDSINAVFISFTNLEYQKF